MSTVRIRRAYAQSYVARVEFMRRFIAPSLLKNSRVLDAGCGRHNCLLDHSQVKELIGVDQDRGAIQDNRCIGKGIVADLETMGEIDWGEKFDLVMCVNVTEHLPNPHRFVYNVARLLKTGGHFFLAAPNKVSVAGILTAVLPTRVIRRMSRILEGRETPNEAHYYRFNTVPSIRRCLLDTGFDDLQFVLLSSLMGRRWSARWFCYLPDYLVGRTGLITYYSVQLLCLAQLVAAPPPHPAPEGRL